MTTQRCAGKIASALRSEFEVFEGQDDAQAYKLLEGSELDVLLLGMPIESGGLKQCIELFSRLDGSDIDTLVIVLSSDESKAAALKVIDVGPTTTSSSPSIRTYCAT